VLDFSLATDPEGPLLVISKAGTVESFQRRGQGWEHMEVLVSAGRPAGLGSGGWLLVSVVALAVLALAAALFFVRGGAVEEQAPHTEIAYASIPVRGVACAFDIILTFFLVSVVAGLQQPETTAAVVAGAHIAYAALSEAYWGRTLGKKLVGIVVVTPELEAIGLGRSALRNTIRLVDSIPMPVYVIGVVSMLGSTRRQRLGDRLAGTVVLRESALLVPRATTLRQVPASRETERQV